MSNNKKSKIQQSPNEIIYADEISIRSLNEQIKQKIPQILLNSYLRSKLMKKKIQQKMIIIVLVLGKQQQFQIFDVILKLNEQIINQKNINLGNKVVQISKFTKITFFQKSVENKQEQKKKGFENRLFFGRQEEYSTLRQLVTKSLFNKNQLNQTGLGCITGILINGFSGTGKTTILKVLEKDLLPQKIVFKSISSFNLLSKYVGGSQQAISDLFAKAKQSQPSCLIIEDLHLIFPKSSKSQNETALASLLFQLENIKSYEQLIVIATYNSERELNENIRRSGKFQKQITLQLPRHHQRLKLLKGFIQAMKLDHPISEQQIKYINLRLNGFNVGEIQQIFRDCYIQKKNKTDIETIQFVLKQFKPRQIKQLIVQVPEVYWNQIGGYQEVKHNITQVIQWPLKRPEIYQKLGIQSMKGILLYGPPGCSKTMMAKAIATQSKLNFIGIKGPQLFSKYVGESQKAVRNIFKRARACSPCVIFFDEIDALATQRSANTEVSDRVLCQLLNQMDGIQGLKEVIIVAATNRPQILDKALLRPGRFDHLIYVGPPDIEARKQIFKIYLSKMPIKQNKEQIVGLLAEKTGNYTGAQISLLCRAAALEAFSEDPQVTMKHFEKALQKVKNRLTQTMLQQYRAFNTSFTYI